MNSKMSTLRGSILEDSDEENKNNQTLKVKKWDDKMI